MVWEHSLHLCLHLCLLGILALLRCHWQKLDRFGVRYDQERSLGRYTLRVPYTQACAVDALIVVYPSIF